eukprot:m51a1_g7427 putative pas domain-containing protein tyrosine kinase (472) ;mRNA; f:31549-33266
MCDGNTYGYSSYSAADPQSQAPCRTSASPASARIQVDTLDWRDITFVRRIGGGHFGTVFLAQHAGSHAPALPCPPRNKRFSPRREPRLWGIDVAVKVLNGQAKEDVAASWAREVGVLRTLRHPNCVLFLGACSSPQGPMIATEYLSFGSLHAWLSDPAQRVTGAQAVAAAQQSAHGMRYLHEQRPPVLHKDLTSSNILIDASGCVKIADFGLSTIQRATAKSAGSEYLTNIRWRAPEVTSKNFEPASDVFSWGLVLYEIMSRTLPWGDLSDSEAHQKLVQGDLPLLPPSPGAAWMELFSKCCNVNPAARPTFHDITDEILEVLERLASLKVPLELNELPVALPKGVCFATVVSTFIPAEKMSLAGVFKDVESLSVIKERCACWVVLHTPGICKMTVIIMPKKIIHPEMWGSLRPSVQKTRDHMDAFAALPITRCPGEANIFDLRAGAKCAEVVWFIADVLESRDRNIPDIA